MIPSPPEGTHWHPCAFRLNLGPDLANREVFSKNTSSASQSQRCWLPSYSLAMQTRMCWAEQSFMTYKTNVPMTFPNAEKSKCQGAEYESKNVKFDVEYILGSLSTIGLSNFI